MLKTGEMLIIIDSLVDEAGVMLIMTILGGLLETYCNFPPRCSPDLKIMNIINIPLFQAIFHDKVLKAGKRLKYIYCFRSKKCVKQSNVDHVDSWWTIVRESSVLNCLCGPLIC